MLKKFWQWLVLSSADPKKTSLFVKGVLTSAVAYLVFFSGMIQVDLASTDFNAIIETITTIVELVLSLVAMFMTLAGFIRKIGTTITGNNKVIQEQRLGNL